MDKKTSYLLKLTKNERTGKIELHVIEEKTPNGLRRREGGNKKLRFWYVNAADEAELKRKIDLFLQDQFNLIIDQIQVLQHELRDTVTCTRLLIPTKGRRRKI